MSGPGVRMWTASQFKVSPQVHEQPAHETVVAYRLDRVRLARRRGDLDKAVSGTMHSRNGAAHQGQ
jgi:hypothetical protein